MLMKQLFIFRATLARDAAAARLDPLPSHDPRFEPIGHMPQAKGRTPCATAHSGKHSAEIIRLEEVKRTRH